MRLAAQTGDTVFLMARSGFQAVCVDRQEGSYMIYSLTGHVGSQILLGVGPASHAILAFLSPDKAAVVLAANAGLYPAYNNLSADDVAAGLPDIRARGYAVDEGRLVEGISAVAVPIRPQGRGVVAALSINMTTARLEAELQASAAAIPLGSRACCRLLVKGRQKKNPTTEREEFVRKVNRLRGSVAGRPDRVRRRRRSQWPAVRVRQPERKVPSCSACKPT
jgi:hypothetical protein